MKAIFVETTGFTKAISGFVSDQTLGEFQQFLMKNPNAGVVMPGCGGLRKIRTPDAKRGKGKRGGARVIYLHVPEARRFYMLDVYSKDEKDDLSGDEKKQLRRIVERLKFEALAAIQRGYTENL
jgi:hypothetical protein